MRLRLVLVLAVLSLTAAACGNDTSVGRGRPDGAGPALAAQQVAYRFDTGNSSAYRFSMSADLDMGFSGDAALGGMPDSMSMAMDIDGRIAYRVEDGEEPNTWAVTMDMFVDEVNVRDTDIPGLDGELAELTAEEMGAEFAAPSITLVLDEQGRVVEGAPFGYESFESFGFQPGQLFGPPLPEGEMGVGTTWSSTESVDVPFLAESLEYTWTSEVVGTADWKGRSVFVIETATGISEIKADMVDMVGSFNELSDEELAAAGLSRSDVAGLSAQMQFMDMEFRIEAVDATSVAWLDPAAGEMVYMDMAMPMTMTTSMGTPEGTMTSVVRMDMFMEMEMLGGETAS